MTIRLTILMLLTFGVIRSEAQTANFNYTTLNGIFCHPQTVMFTQNCSGSPTRFIWDFGNGQTSSNATANISYDLPGNYTVTLTAIYQNTAATISKIVVINPTPVLTLTADKNYLCQPGSILFSVTTTDPVANYEWDFGDGSPIITTVGTSNSINHNYTTYNSFTTKVKGITAAGCTAFANYTVEVKKFPITGIVDPSSGCIPMNSIISVTTNLPAGDATQNFVWNFGDGSPTSSGGASSISHLYNIVSPITTASVSITTVQGCTNQFVFPEFAYGTPPFGTVAKTVTARDTFCGSETIQFYGKATTANSYNWDFGDGTNTTVTDTLVSYKYRSLGNKRVIVTPYFNGCAGLKDTIDIFIKGVIANYTFSNTCGNKNTYLFNNQSLGNIDHFEWTFSDAATVIDSVNFSPTHTFPSTGVFYSHLFLVDRVTGCTDFMDATLVTARPSLTRSINAVCKDSLIIYTVNNTYPVDYGYTYEFHVNGTVVNNNGDSVLSFNPAIHGSFAEYVVIKDNNAGTCNDTLLLTGNTLVRGPVVDFNFTPRVCNDTGVVFMNNSFPFFASDPIVKWNWSFGDSKFDTVQNPQPHVYPSPANFIIKLTATDVNGCSGKIQYTVGVDPLPAMNVFPAVDTICLGDTAILRGYTADTLSWIPPTNIDCTTCDTVKVYPNITTSYVAQAVNRFGCHSYDTALVKVYGPINLQVFPADTTICPGQLIPYDLNADGITVWSPATFLSNDKIRNPLALPDTAITYTIAVTDSVGCYTDTAFAFVRMLPEPTVDAGPDLILPYNTAFTLTPVYSNDVVSYTWTPPGNLNCTNCANPAGIALQKDIYQVEATNSSGCKASDIIIVVVNCERSNLLMPTAFTPNRDGKNDYFYPITRGYRSVKTFLIFNRYGNKVFERKDFAPNIQSLGWDGSVKNLNSGPNEVFSWFMEAECDAGQIVTTKGTVVLIR